MQISLLSKSTNSLVSLDHRKFLESSLVAIQHVRTSVKSLNKGKIGYTWMLQYIAVLYGLASMSIINEVAYDI